MSLTCPTCRTNYAVDTAECPNDGSALLPDEAFAHADADLEPGTMIGEYRVEKKLGEGSFGAVYAGIQPLIGKKVAIKLLHKRMSSEPDIVARFIDEARAVNRIGHRNIIDVFSFGVHASSQHYFVMEFCEGLTLGELIHQKKRIDIEEALPILQGIASGLDAAHEAGVTHRDLKPDNIFLVRERSGGYSPKLLDFGVAKLARDEGGVKTATGIAIGTPRYMSPEQCRGKKIDHRSDIYSLGCVIFEMLTGKPVFDADSTVDLLFKHTSDKPPTMSSVAPGIAPDLDEPVLVMLAKKPNGRPNSASAAIAAIDAAWQNSAHRIKRQQIATTETGEAPAMDVADPALAQTAAVTAQSGDEFIAEASAKTTDVARTEIAPIKSPVDATLASVPMNVAISDKPISDVVVARTNSTNPGVAATLVTSSENVRRGKPLALFGVGAIIVVAAIGVISMRRDTSSPTSNNHGSTPNSSVTLTPEPSTITLRVAVMPADARIVIDGRDMGGSGDTLTLPREKKKHSVRIEHPGYESQTMWISFEADEEIGPISLAALPTAPIAPSASASALTPVGKPSTTTKRVNKDLWKPEELGGSP